METITLELRPRLRSLSAYISLKKDIDTSTIKVKLVEDAIEIQIEGHIHILPLHNVKLQPSSLSSLGITNRWISFRIQTQPNAIYGTFETEVIKYDNKVPSGFYSNQNGFELIPKAVDSKLICVCCKNEISMTTRFQRILPLPSDECDPQEWFCCKHDGEDSFSLDPKESDLFYSINYCLLNKNILNKDLKLRNSLVHCNRCLSILGSLEGKEQKVIKLWNCCIEFKALSKNSYSVIKCSSSALSDFLSVIKQESELTIGEKLLLEARDINSVHYILMRPMEAKLNLLTVDESSLEKDKVDLKSLFVMKVLYKYGESTTTLKYNPDIKYCELALPSILAGMDQLVTSSACFPPAYRKAEDFYIGYLPV